MTSSADALVSYVLVTYNRPDDLADAIDSVLTQTYRPIEVVVVSNSTDDTGDLFAEGGPYDRDCIEYHHYPGRMGVPQARNVAFEHASGDIIVTLDDDAVLGDDDATDRVVSLFDRHEDVGALAFQSRNYHTGEVNPKEIPDPPDFSATPTDQFRTTNFVGVGNALRRDALDAAGPYPEEFVYGFEEMDLSFQLHDAGYDILYAPSVVVYHKKSPAARRSDAETLERLVGNRIRLAFRNLPWRYVVLTTLIWSVYGLVVTRNPSSLANIFTRLYENRQGLLADRQVISDRTIRRIKARRSMLFGWWYGPHPRRFVGPDGDLRRLTRDLRTS